MTAPARRRPAVSEFDAQMLALVAEGRTSRDIGRQLGRTAHGVQSHLSRLYRRMGVANAPHAVAAAFALGILPLNRPAGHQ